MSGKLARTVLVAALALTPVLGATSPASAYTLPDIGLPPAGDDGRSQSHKDCDAASIVAPGHGGVGAGLTSCILASQEDQANTKRTRGQFVQELLTLIDTEVGNWYNVMIFDIKGKNVLGNDWFVHDYQENFKDVAFTMDVDWDDPTSREDQTFRIWVFSGGGTFVNPGDGGWINWGFSGNFTRRTEGGKGYVDFSPTYVPGSPSGAVPITNKSPMTPVGPDIPRIYPEGEETPQHPITYTATATTAPPTIVPVYIHTQQSLAAVPNAAKSGAKIVAGKYGTPGALWTVTPLSNGRYRIDDGISLSLTTNTTTWQANLAPWTGSTTQQWEIVPNGSGTFQIRNSSQDCLTFDEAYKTLGVWTCEGSKAQQFGIAQ
ncbi:RICIN domain-containing protein [Streptomyces sp. OfavH-34-F]|uniref:RICIN domain-containing protein n=1 Tax=Streptomyces sp. OfavH-34-F TaxID=2917760 RepID=UPI0023B7A1BB|nr:ricin-type beta-trefoil lectin domain protein [Streptomyces sp. OfavH-34-F]